MTRFDPGGDDTVRISPAHPPPPKGGPRRLPLAALIGGTLVVVVAGWMLWPRPAPIPPPGLPAVPPQAVLPAVPIAPPVPVAPGEFRIETATEQEIRNHTPGALTVFRLAANPLVLVLDFASLREQGLMLNRVAALTEKGRTPRAHVLTDEELDQAIRAGGDTVETFYYGHDYSAAALARFFALADAEHIALLPEEERLRRLLQQLGWLAPGVHAGLISIPKVGADAHVAYSARSAILRHELSHGEYFSNPAYAAYVHRFWMTTLTAGERDGVRQFLAAEEYDVGLEELMENEMQAYLMFTRDPAFFTAERVGMTQARLTDLQATFMRGLSPGWLRDMMTEPMLVPAAAR